MINPVVDKVEMMVLDAILFPVLSYYTSNVDTIE